MKKKYFGTDGIRGKVGNSLISADWILKLGWSVGKLLSKNNDRNWRGKVLIGKDTRISGYMFESALEAGLAASGVDIYLLGPMPTPAIAYLTRTFQASAGIVISASHNPYYDNGIKFICSDGYKFSDEMELEIEENLNKEIDTVTSRELGRAKRIDDAAGRYIEFCKSSLSNNINLKGMKIVLDCANGATYHVAPSIFKELGANVMSIGTDPDGININKNCGSTYPEILAKTVLQQKADLGIAFDGDGDRVIMIDHTGAIVNGDEIIFVIAKWYKENNCLLGGVVGTQMSNMGMELALADLNIPFIRTKVGDRYVLRELHNNNWNLGGESSGHIICSDINTTGDGIVSSLQVLGAMKSSGKTLFALKQQMTKFPQVLINVSVNDENPKDIIHNSEITKAVRVAEKKLNGIGRVLLRPSGTEPLVRIMVEGKELNQINAIAKELELAVKSTIECYA